MQTFYQGSMRCKDFIPFFKNILETHNWSVVDSNISETGQWFVVQKLAVTGGVMTFAVKENYFPNFGDLSIVGSLASDMGVDGNGVYISAYDPLTKTLQNVYSRTGTYSSNTVPKVIDNPGTYPLISTCKYYTSGKVDDDITLTHVFYIISMFEDGFFIKMRGNPAVSGYGTNYSYCGSFDKTIPEFITDDSIGLWGMMSLAGNQVSRLNNVDNTNPGAGVGWRVYDPRTYLDYYNLTGDSYPTPSFDGQMVLPIFAFIEEHYQYPLVVLPQNLVYGATRGTGLYDENVFVEINGNKYIFIDTNQPHGILIKVMDGASNVVITDTGVGYEISWLNPSDAGFKKVALYGKLGSYPTGHDDIDAVKIYENAAAVAGASESFTDTDAGRYGQAMYYAVIAFDSAPVPQASMVTDKCKAKISPSIAALDVLPTKFNNSLVDYNYSNEALVNVYCNPVAVYNCNDNTSDTVVVDEISGLHGAATANTDTLSIAGKIGTALDLSANKRIIIPPANELVFPNNFTIQGWLQAPAAYAGYNTLWGTEDAKCALRYNYNSTTPEASSFSVELDGNWVNFPVPYLLDNTAMHFISFVKNGMSMSIYVDGEPSISGALSTKTWGKLNSGTTIGGRGGSDLFKGIYDAVEFYPYALSHLQIKYNYNNGNGRAIHLSDVVDGMSIVSEVASVGEQVERIFPDPLNMSGITSANVDCFSKRLGENFKVVFTNTDGISFSANIESTLVGAWETKIMDFSAIPANTKREIKKISLEILNADERNIISIKNIVKA